MTTLMNAGLEGVVSHEVMVSALRAIEAAQRYMAEFGSDEFRASFSLDGRPVGRVLWDSVNQRLTVDFSIGWRK